MRRRRNHRADHLQSIETALAVQRSRVHAETEDLPMWRYKGDTFKHHFNSKETWNSFEYHSKKSFGVKESGFRIRHLNLHFMLWLAMHNRLSTGERMLSWNTGANSSCLLCHDPLESREHLSIYIGCLACSN